MAVAREAADGLAVIATALARELSRLASLRAQIGRLPVAVPAT
jgi:hypothetical protein